MKEINEMVVIPGDSINIDNLFFGLGKISIQLDVSGLNIESVSYEVNGFLFGWFLITF